MDHWTALLIALVFLAYALATRRLGRTVLTGPLLFAGLGLVLGPALLGWVEPGIGNSALHTLAELTLVLVLFTDAASTDLGMLTRVRSLPTRMLLIGLPLTILLGTLVALGLFPDLSLWSAALLAAILSPTDAALGQPVLDNEAVPAPIRAAIGSESGLNDGLALPAVLVFAALASGSSEREVTAWFGLVGQQLLLGPLAGIMVGSGGGWLLERAWQAGWMEEWAEGIAALAIALAAFVLAEAVHGNGFLAAFAGGLAMGRMLGRRCRYAYQFQRSEAHILILGTFFIVGAVLLPEGAAHLTWPCVIFALFALTVMRMLPIAISLTGLGLGLRTAAFIGWFGPRGLASVLFTLIILEGAGVPDSDSLLAAVALTVTLSIVLHGLTAAPLASAYARQNIDPE